MSVMWALLELCPASVDRSVQRPHKRLPRLNPKSQVLRSNGNKYPFYVFLGVVEKYVCDNLIHSLQSVAHRGLWDSTMKSHNRLLKNAHLLKNKWTYKLRTRMSWEMESVCKQRVYFHFYTTPKKMASSGLIDRLSRVKLPLLRVRGTLRSNLGWDTVYLDYGFSWFSWDPPGNCLDSTSTRPRPLPSASLQNHHSTVILSFNAIESK
jgi:hypothetical protein